MISPVSTSGSYQAFDDYNTEVAKNPEHPDFWERALKAVTEPAIKLWHKGDDRPRERMMLAGLFALIVGILLLQLYTSKIQPFINQLEVELFPTGIGAEAFTGGMHLLIAAKELGEYIVTC